MDSKTQLRNLIDEKDLKIRKLQEIINRTNRNYSLLVILKDNLQKEVFRLKKIIEDSKKPKKWYEFWR